jgi:hypothetical protein
MASPPKGCLFLDSCVAFAEILEEYGEVMEKLKLDVKRRSISCYISESARVECEKKLNDTERFFDNVFRTFAVGHFNFSRQQMGRNPSDPISRDDFKIFASLFNELRKNVRAVLQKPLRELEIKMVMYAEDLIRKGTKIDFVSFMQKFIGEALVLAANLRIQKVRYITNEQGFFKKNSALPDSRISAQLLANIRRDSYYPFHKEDADNISSAWSHMTTSGQNTVFASFDFRTVISHAEEIFNLIKLYCADPLYAVHFL